MMKTLLATQDPSLVRARGRSAVRTALPATLLTGVVWACFIPAAPPDKLGHMILVWLFGVLPLSFLSLWITGLALPPGRQRLARAPFFLVAFWQALMTLVVIAVDGLATFFVAESYKNLVQMSLAMGAPAYGGLLLLELVQATRRWWNRRAIS